MALTNSTFYLLSVPFDKTQKNQIAWKKIGDWKLTRENYFNSCVKHIFSDCYYIRKDHAFKANKPIDELYDSNYVMYENPAYNDKIFYAFIERYEYINENSTLVYLKTDVFQTWYEEAILNPSFVVREHVSDDSKYANLIPESFEYGDYITANKTLINLNEMVIVVAYIDIVDDSLVVSGELRQNVYTGLKYVWYRTTEIDALNEMLDGFASIGKLDNIINIFMMPYYFTADPESVTPTEFINFNPTTIDGYTPKNNKLFNFPFTFVSLSNCQGVNVPLKFEYFENAKNMKFGTYYIYNDKPSCMCVPLAYKNNPANWDEGVILDEFPVCAWVGDTYKNWYAKNKITIEQQKLANFFTMASGIGVAAVSGGGLAALAGAGTAFSALGSTMSLLAEVEQKSLFPEQLMQQSKNNVLNNAWGRVGFEVKVMTIKAEFAKIIDGFFELYGYKVASLKVPDIFSRPYWNYIQCIDINITGNIPTNDIAELKSIYNDGITLWHSTASFMDYSKNNHYTITDEEPEPPIEPPIDESEIRMKSILTKARSYIGTTEKPVNNVIFNTHYYGHEVSGDYPWCVTFVWDIFRMCQLSELFYGGNMTASSTTLMNYAESHGLAVNKDDLQSGDIVFYSWTGSKVVADHTEICTGNVTNSSITAIGGNSGANSNKVIEQTRNKSLIIKGYRPQY